MTPPWTGIAVALATLFDDEKTVAVEQTAEHAARLVEAGVRAVVVAGSTGEAAALNDTERVALLAAVRAACPDVPVVAGASAEWWRPAAERVVAAVSAGAEAVLVAPPRSGDLDRYFTNVAAAAGQVPVLAYHFPPNAGGPVPVEALAGLPVQGIKDSTGDPERMLAQLESWSGWIYSGAAVLTSYAATVGAAGSILVAANIAPEDCVAAWSGDGKAQRRLLAVHRACRSRFPHGLKEAMAQRWSTPVGSRLG
ncbi:4-hydroxy-tetrahydrodipicolinate synthase [Virgisporangium ochraceum]